jgi:hypothetical protein
MWEAIKNALIGVKDATGIEIPALPSDLGAIGKSASTAVQSATESANGVIDGGASAIDAVTGSMAGVSEAAATTVDTATQGLPDIAARLIDGSRGK